MTMKLFSKSLGAAGAKAMTAAPGGAAVSAEQLAKINAYALSALAAEEVYVRKYLIAHNMVDRDRERFSEALLDDFASTFPGKSYLFAHDRHDYLPLGLIFDAATETMTAEAFSQLSGEPAKLPEGVTEAKVVWAWFYIPRTDTAADIIKNIEAGIYRHGSIGFAAADLAPVKGEYDQILFYEYQGPGEAREASLVWLGAQPGATTQKAAAATDNPQKHQGDTNMKALKTLLGTLLGKSFSEDAGEQTVFDAVKGALAEKDQRITALEDEKAQLAPLAEDGKSYRKHLVDEYVRMKTALGECKEDPEAAKTLSGYVNTLPVDFLKSEVDALSGRMEEKFPAKGQTRGDARRDKSTDGKGAGGENENELIPKEE